MMRLASRSIIAFVAAVLWASAALAQSVCPPLNYGTVLTAGQWQACFAAKEDNLGYVPVNKAGDVMTGRLVLPAAPSGTRAGFNLTPGAAPSAPVDGDAWTTTTGIFVRINGSTIGPLQGPGSGASFAATAPLSVSFPSGVTTYGLDLSHPNTWSGAQTFSGGGSFATSFSAPGLVNLSDFAAGSQNTIIGYFGSTALSAATLPSCSTATSGLVYNNSTHLFGCNGGLGGIPTLNSLSGALSITAGTGIQVNPSSPNIAIALTAARQTLPTVCAGFSGGTCPASGSGTYTTPANVLWIEVNLIGAGGGGGGGNNAGSAGTGGDTCWAASGSACSSPLLDAGGGTGGNSNNPGTGGTVSGSASCSVLSVAGADGQNGNISTSTASAQGGSGGSSSIGGAGAGGRSTAVNPTTPKANSGSGGGGGGQSTTTPANAGNGGGSGATCKAIINGPAASYTFNVGGAGSAATGGTNGNAGSAGAAGKIVVVEHYGS